MSNIWTEERKALALAELESWRGHRHCDRIAVKGVGIDCIHLVYRAYIAAGILPEHPLGSYDVTAGIGIPSNMLRLVLQRCLTCEVVPPMDVPEFGDIANFKTGKTSSHVGFYANGKLWHSLTGRGVLVGNWELWRHKVENIIRLTGEGFSLKPVEARKTV